MAAGGRSYEVHCNALVNGGKSFQHSGPWKAPSFGTTTGLCPKCQGPSGIAPLRLAVTGVPTTGSGSRAAPTVPLHSGAELLAACKNSEPDEAMRLLGIEGVDVNAKDENGMTPLHWACYIVTTACAHRPLRKMTLSELEDEVHQGYAGGFRCDPCRGNSEFSWHCMTCHSDTCETCYSNARTTSDYILGEVALALVANEAIDVNAKDKSGKTALQYGVLYAHEAGLGEVAAQMIAAGACHSGNELLEACRNSNAGRAMRLLGIKGIDVNAKDGTGGGYYISGNRATSVQDYYGMTPLHLACDNGLKEVALALVANEAFDVNAKYEDGKTPLLYACDKGFEELALALLTIPDTKIHTVDPTSKFTPLFLALDKQHFRVLHAAQAHPRFNAESLAHAAVQKYYAKLDAFLGRYTLDPVPSVHRSATCLVRLARDIEANNAPVALKLMRNHDEFKREIAMREHICTLSAFCALRAHTNMWMRTLFLNAQRNI